MAIQLNDNFPASLKKRFQKMNSQEFVSREEFLSFAKLAIDAYNTDPAMREELARLVTSVWFDYSDTWNDDDLDEIGNEFADLELPDAHVWLRAGESIEGKWRRLGKTVEQLLRQNE